MYGRLTSSLGLLTGYIILSASLNTLDLRLLNVFKDEGISLQKIYEVANSVSIKQQEMNLRSHNILGPLN